MGTPINELPGSEFISNAFLNVKPEDKQYKRIMKMKEDGYMPEHQSIFVNTLFPVSDGVNEDVIYMHSRFGISDGAVNRIHSFNTGGTSAKTRAGPGVSFILYNNNNLNIPITTSSLTERMALLAMDGYNPALFRKDMTAEEIDDIDMRANIEVALSVKRKIDFYNSRVISSAPFNSTPEANLDAMTSMMSGTLLKDFKYSIPNHTCQNFADALYNNMLKGEQSPILGGFDFNSHHNLKRDAITYDGLEKLLENAYSGILGFDINVFPNPFDFNKYL